MFFFGYEPKFWGNRKMFVLAARKRLKFDLADRDKLFRSILMENFFSKARKKLSDLEMKDKTR